jgi:hypothetical protein
LVTHSVASAALADAAADQLLDPAQPLLCLGVSVGVLTVVFSHHTGFCRCCGSSAA